MQKVSVFVLLTLLIVGVIWGNSMQTVERSEAQSTQIAESLQPVLDAKEELAEREYHRFVRKLAHVTEFFLLGLAVAGFGISLSVYLKKTLISLPLLMVLFVAVADEYIQHFSDRGSLVTDVVLDFVSAVVALGLVWLIVSVRSFTSQRRRCR